jgi:hypothetical protein
LLAFALGSEGPAQLHIAAAPEAAILAITGMVCLGLLLRCWTVAFLGKSEVWDNFFGRSEVRKREAEDCTSRILRS